MTAISLKNDNRIREEWTPKFYFTDSGRILQMNNTGFIEKASLNNSWHIKFTLLLLTIFLAIASCIKAPGYAYEGGSLFLQHLGTLVLLLPLALELRHPRLSVSACVCLFIFACIHILGARYLYTYVPYDEWAKKLLNIDLNIKGDGVIHGNKYDRLVHLAFGLLMFPVVFQLAKRVVNGDNIFLTLLLAWLTIQTFSMVYEVFEWILSIVLSPKEAEEYNGQQGDMWDAQKDMALALLGSTISAIYTCFFHRRKHDCPQA